MNSTQVKLILNMVKMIKSKIFGEFQQEYIYDEQGILSAIEVFEMKNETAKSYFKVVFECYQQSDLAELLEENQN